jgi:hypothetical protein
VLLASDGSLEAFIGFGPDLLNVGRAALGQFRVFGRIPGPGGELQGFALFVAPNIAPEDFDGVGGARLVHGCGKPVEFVGQFFRYLNDARHRFLV